MAQQSRGSALIPVIIAIMILGAIGAGLASLVSSGFRSTADHSLSIQALYLAESGFEWAAAELQEVHGQGSEWEETCNNLSSDYEPQQIDDAGYFNIIESGVTTGPRACKIKILGLTGDSEPADASASRRLEAKIRQGVIEGSAESESNIFDNENDWSGVGANVNFEDGAMILERPGGGQGKGGGNTNTKADGRNIIEEQFESGDTVYFAANTGWDDTPVDEVFSIDLKINGQSDINCDMNLPSLDSDCSVTSGPLDDEYNTVLKLGDNINAENIEKITLEVDWGGGDTEEVILENGCIGTEEYCLGNTEPQNPVEDGSWEEG